MEEVAGVEKESVQRFVLLEADTFFCIVDGLVCGDDEIRDSTSEGVHQAQHCLSNRDEGY